MIYCLLNDNQKIKEDITPLYLSAFPEEERPPENIFYQSFERKENRLYAFYDNDVFVGFCSITLFEDVCCIFFLAVSSSLRHQGYGHQIISIIKELYKDYTLMLCYEEIDDKYLDNEMRKKRESFYQDNGFQRTDVLIEEYGVRYHIASIGPRKIAFAIYQNIFKTMFKYGNLKRLKEVIK